MFWDSKFKVEERIQLNLWFMCTAFDKIPQESSFSTQLFDFARDRTFATSEKATWLPLFLFSSTIFVMSKYASHTSTRKSRHCSRAYVFKGHNNSTHISYMKVEYLTIDIPSSI